MNKQDKIIIEEWSKITGQVKNFSKKSSLIKNDVEEDFEEDIEEIKNHDVEIDSFTNYLRDVEKIKLYNKNEEIEMFNNMNLLHKEINRDIFYSIEGLCLLITKMEECNREKEVSAIHFFGDQSTESNNLISRKNALLKRLDEYSRDYYNNEENYYEDLGQVKFDVKFLLECIKFLESETHNIKEIKSKIKKVKEIKEKIVLRNLKLVVKIAKNYQGCEHFKITDLIQEGNIGLMRGIDKFEPKHNTQLSTYVSNWIRQSINDALSKKSRTIKIPNGLINILYQLNQLEKAEQINREKVSAEEVAELLDIDLSKAKKILNIPANVLSLDFEYEQDDKKSLSEYIVGGEEPEEVLEENEISREINKLIENFPEREKVILNHYYGLNGLEPKTLDEISKMLNLTRERIRQLDIHIRNKILKDEGLYNQFKSLLV